jgi:hypothetical protein
MIDKIMDALVGKVIGKFEWADPISVGKAWLRVGGGSIGDSTWQGRRERFRVWNSEESWS